MSPVASPAGVPVVIRVPGVKAGQKAKQEQISAINQRVEKELARNAPATKPDPRILTVGTVGPVGDVKSKKGERFVGYMPVVVVRAAYPAEAVDRAAGLIAAAYYRAAQKHYKVVPVTELANQPRKTKP